MSKRVLLIEDDQTVRENTEELLMLSDYKVYTAKNGKEGVAVAKKELPDIIVCDVMMPEMDGYGVLTHLAEDEKTLAIPFIFLSAKTDHKDIRKGMDLGADDYLTKPFEEDDLINAIESRIAKVDILKSRRQNESSIKQNLNITHFKESLKTYPTQNFSAGDYIYQPNEAASNLYLIKRGVVKSYHVDASGKELITGLHKIDSFFGNLIFKKPVVHKEYAAALEDSEIHCIPKQDVQSFLEANHHVLYDIIDILDEHLEDTKNQLLDMAYSSVQRKTAQTILLFTERLKKNKLSQIRISRSDLASVAGIASESLIRTLSKFKKQGILEIEGRNIKINDFEALEKIT
ncbi:response regulator [Psychroflexus salis]|uniref:Transcriptional regulator n=1 Tax=Psychroflexus salis TaxID=1526574 RepID=A0A916ZYA4_9FLAO|nr:response regulator [Psychroflexus salis]GGE18763.1 transcriptional regulator [Psychroflexus salis]